MTKQFGSGNGESLDLTGTGAAYIRVSTDQQDTERQYASAHAFEQRHGVTIAKQHWFKDEGWARDADKQRPEFNRLLALAESGRVQWIVVDSLDRFGTKTAKHLMGYLARLEDAGCRLYDASGKEWTGEDDATEITAWVNGKSSMKEQREKSHRVLGGKAEKARTGEWQGGPVRLGFDVTCYHRETNKELWRVIFEGRNRRLKVYPDGRAERFDGEQNFPKSQLMIEVLRIAPSKDKAKIDAAVSIFKRYATESISFTGLAHYLDKLGWRNGGGGCFQSPQIEEMLRDPAYLGYYTWNKWHFGKFHRYTEGQTVPELNYGEKGSKNNKADWVQSHRLFEPLVDRQTWDAVQRKLAKRSETKRVNAPRSVEHYLAGLIVCSNCGRRMVSGLTRETKSKPRKDGHTGKRYEYFCGTYFKAVREGRRKECTCLRNGVFQDTLEVFIDRYLEETGQRLELLTDGLDANSLTDQLRQQATDHWQAFRAGVERLTSYLAQHHPDEYDAIRREFAESQAASEDAHRQQGGAGNRPRGSLAERLGARGHDAHERAKRQPTTPGGFIDACLASYRGSFDPSVLTAEIDRLEAEHSDLMRQWSDLPTPRAREKARERFAHLEARIDDLRRQQEDVAGGVEQHYREMLDLQRVIADAKTAMQSKTGERALRQRAQALRAVIQRIECTFTATGVTGSGWGKRNSQLATVTFYPIVGESVELSADSKGTLLYSSAHSFM